MLFEESMCRCAERTCFSQISCLSPGAAITSSSSWIGIRNRIQILFIGVNAVEFLHWEAFTAPADEKPYAADEDQELENAVENGNLRTVLIFPAGIQMVGTVPYPSAVQGKINNHAQRNGDKTGPPDAGVNDMGNPIHGHVAGKEEFSWGEYQSGEMKVEKVNERAEGEIAGHGQHNDGHHLLSQNCSGNDVHHEEQEEKNTESGEKIRGEMIKVRIVGTVQCMGDAVREYGNPEGKGNISNPPERMKHIFPGHELSEEQHDKTLHHTALETIP